MFVVMQNIDLFVDLQIKCLFCFSEQNKRELLGFLVMLVERIFLFVFALYVFN